MVGHHPADFRILSSQGDKTEVDIVMESGQKVWGVEIKAAVSVNRDDAKGLIKLAGLAGERFQAGIVFYDGEATLPLHEESGILAFKILILEICRKQNFSIAYFQ